MNIVSTRTFPRLLQTHPPRVTLHPKADLAADIRDHWVNGTEWGISCCGLTVHLATNTLRFSRYRLSTVSAVFEWRLSNPAIGVMVRVSVDESPEIDAFVTEGTGVITLEVADHEAIDEAIRSWKRANPSFIEREERFLSEKPWEALEGLTPEAAIAKLTELGWPPERFKLDGRSA
jgi:hypothetical protein